MSDHKDDWFSPSAPVRWRMVWDVIQERICRAQRPSAAAAVARAMTVSLRRVCRCEEGYLYLYLYLNLYLYLYLNLKMLKVKPIDKF